MEQVIQQRDCFSLVQSEEGFVWTMMSEGGVRWYWHPQTQTWTGRLYPSRTPEAATNGLDPTAALSENPVPSPGRSLPGPAEEYTDASAHGPIASQVGEELIQAEKKDRRLDGIRPQLR